MKTVQKLKFFSFLMAMPFVTNAALDCPYGRLLDVSGSFTQTNTISAEVQAGKMHLKLSDASGTEVYNQDCGLIGKVVKTTTVATKLNHTIICSSKYGFNTIGDKAIVTGTNATPENPIPTVLYMHEDISTVEHGTGLFRNMKVDMSADGTIDLSTGMNDFTLTGEVCLEQSISLPLLIGNLGLL